MSDTLKLNTSTSTAATKKRRIGSENDNTAAVPDADVSVAEVSAVDTATTTSNSTASVPSIQSQFEDLLATVATLTVTVRTIMTQLKVAQKEAIRMSKEVAKKNAKASRKVGAKKDGEGTGGGVSKPSGFDKPTLLSDALCSFLNQPMGSRLGRTDVTRMVNAYIKDVDLQDPQDKRRILPDAKLRTVLSLGDDDVLTFFNIQRYIKHNFLKDEDVAKKDV